jgi:hypothetical protein
MYRDVRAGTLHGGAPVYVRHATASVFLCAWMAGCGGAPGGRSPISPSVPEPSRVPVPAAGPLRVHPANPRYFTDGSGKAVYLAGSHTWNALYDAFHPLDYSAYLDFLARHNHNFMKFRAWDSKLPYPPGIYKRTGPGAASDGLPRVDLEQFDPAHFDRMRERLIAARDRGIYVLIMLFETEEMNGDPRQSDPARSNTWHQVHPSQWACHPCNRLNNINGIDGGNADNTAPATTETLANPAITRLREAYLRKVVDTVNDLDNVLFEIANETHNVKPGSTDVSLFGSRLNPHGPLAPFDPAWSYHLIDLLHAYEKTKPKQHPVVMTMPMGAPNRHLYQSPAEGISPGGAEHQKNPPAADGRKVVLTDPDHYGWIDWRGTRSWAWKSFTRGLNPIPLDSLPSSIRGSNGGGWGGGDMPAMVETRSALGHTRAYATRMNLAAMVPRNDLSSTAFCLADPGSEYLVYQPDDGGFTVTLTARTYACEWFDPVQGSVAGTGIVEAAGGDCSFTAPFAGDAVLYLKAADRHGPR